MKDIDFDELDRAVGSALGTDDAADSETSTVTVASTTDSNPQDDAPLPLGTDAPAPRSPIGVVKPASPARRRGQFLDMVHPSADMRSATPLPSMVRKTITPINVDTTPEPASEKPVEANTASYSSYPDSNESDTTDSTPVPVVTEDAASSQVTPVEQSSWPDPIEFASSATKVEDNPESESETSEQPFVAAEYVASEDDSETEPSQTPFVADAKVDKRPLGAFTPADDEIEVPTESPHAADAAQLVASAETPTPEYNSDISSVEAAGVSLVEDEDVAEPAVQASVEKSAAASTPGQPAPVALEPTPSLTNDGVAQSIPQQYKTAEVKKDNDAHSLFDTKEYHQPLLLDGKKKSKKGVFIVILLVILLVIGATLGYFAYTMGI